MAAKPSIKMGVPGGGGTVVVEQFNSHNFRGFRFMVV